MNRSGRTLLAEQRALVSSSRSPLWSKSSSLPVFATRSALYSSQATKTMSGKSEAPSQNKKPIVFSGIQPTGQPHLGNYLGAISNWVTLQEQAQSADETLLFSIVDLHAITLPQDPAKLRKERMEMATTLLACGIDPEKCSLFEQSKVPEHTQLSWILTCMTPVGWLARMTQWKTKLGVTKGAQSLEDVSTTAGLQLGLFAYPVLMAADVLLYKADKIPVGEDQIQHLELARDIAQSFNHYVKHPYFPSPRPIITETKRVMSLRDPASKMSKSNPSDQTRINLVDTPEMITSKIKRAVTDSIRGISYDRLERPAVANLVDIYAAMKRCSVEDIVQEHKDSSNAQFKEALADTLITKLRPIQAELVRLSKEEAYVHSVLDKGAEKAREIAYPNIVEIQKLVGLR
ncbi:Tryptophan--tRNA ligase, mitochondrial [Lunasporangiospora selenospora]|uniref:Tryptophan--tRNA ligase, mitochondrial n=1 Tax=Lunasporangiospora selenospora TaxID=979761 RepID=A0A9P6G2J7_9FUNG|nr:Tryptophan--tRNA ligase, mitochondrial [Lunasporangiospora selenospora]